MVAAMVDILFGQSYYLRFDPKLWEAMLAYPPLGTLYAASLLRQHGYSRCIACRRQWDGSVGKNPQSPLGATRAEIFTSRT